MTVRGPSSDPHASLGLARRVSSVERLVVLLLLAGEPDRAWTTAELAAAARITPTEALAHVRILADDGLAVLDADGRARLTARDEVRAEVAALTALYRQSPEAVLRALSADAMERLRRAAAKITDR